MRTPTSSSKIRSRFLAAATIHCLSLLAACAAGRTTNAAANATAAGPATPACGCTDEAGMPAPLPLRLYAGAIDKAAVEGEPAAALTWLRRSFAAGHDRPSRALAEAAFAPIRRDGALRAQLHALLREFACESSADMVAADEPGERIVVRGIVVDAGGTPIGGARVYAFHTDATGHYSERGLDETNPRLFVHLRTDDAGRFEFKTIRPGHYPRPANPSPREGRGAEGIEQHVHIQFAADGFVAREHRLGFADDPFWARTRQQPPAWAVAGTRSGPDAGLHFDHRIVLQRQP
jgi:hypothetical protein